MNALIPAAMLLIPVICVSAPADPSASSRKDDLGGTWRIVGGESEGERQEAPPSVRYVFSKKNFTIRMKGRPDIKGTFSTSAKARPKQITLVSGTKKKSSVRGIYKFVEDRLILCVAKPDTPRPKQFKTKKGSSFAVIELNRVEEKKEKK